MATSELNSLAAVRTGCGVLFLCFVLEGVIPPLAAQEIEDAGQAPERRGLAIYPEQLRVPMDNYGARVMQWSRDRILDSNAITLLDLLKEIVPGLTPIRGGFFGGPHHAYLGAAGAPFVTLLIDGQEMLPLEGSQVDLARFSLAPVDQVRVELHADGVRIYLTTVRRLDPDAYSRLDAGTGSPGLGIVRGMFANGLGRDFAVATTFDVVNTEALGQADDRFNFRGKLAWVPGARDLGVEFQVRTESNTSGLLGAVERDLSEVTLRARRNFGPQVQAQGFVSRRRLKQKVADVDSVLSEANEFGAEVTAAFPRAFGRAGITLTSEDPFASVQAHVSIGAQPVTGFGVHLSGRTASWDGFTTSEVRGGVAVSRGLPLDAEIGVEAATGTRGASFAVADRADSVAFDAVSGFVEANLGPFRLRESLEYIKLSRQLPLGTALDSAAVAAGPLEVLSFETTLEGPILPLGRIIRGLSPIQVRGSYRHSSLRSGGVAVYVPENLISGEAFFQNSFFDGNLSLRLGVRLERRDAVSAFPLPIDPTRFPRIPSFTDADFNLVLRLLDVRIWWRSDNLGRTLAEDVPGLPYPVTRQAFGIKWEFRN